MRLASPARHLGAVKYFYRSSELLRSILTVTPSVLKSYSDDDILTVVGTNLTAPSKNYMFTPFSISYSCTYILLVILAKIGEFNATSMAYGTLSSV